MIATDHPDRLGIAQALSTATALTPEQAQALADECAKPEYAGMTRAELLIALNRAVEAENTTPRALVSRYAVDKGEWSRLTAQWYLAGIQSGNPQAQQFVSVMYTVAQGMVGMSSIASDHPQTVATLGQLVQMGLATQEEVDGLLMEPDPAWQPLVRLPAPAAVLFGEGAYVDAGDLDAAGVAGVGV